MKRTDRAMITAIREGSEWAGTNVSVELGAVISKPGEPYARNREVRVNGMLVATVSHNIHIRVPMTDKAIIDRLNALLAEFVSPACKVAMTSKHKQLFATHPKTNSLTGKVGNGTTFVHANEWFTVPAATNLDPSVLTE